MKFYQFPNSNCFPIVCYFSREKPLVKPTAPGSLLYYICLCDLFLFAFIFRSIKPKIQKYLAEFYLLLFSSINLLQFLSCLLANFWRRYPKGIYNPFNTSGCEYLLFVCRCRSRSVVWFSYWFDNPGLITEGNTYRSCAASSLPLWENTDVVQAASRGTSPRAVQDMGSITRHYCSKYTAVGSNGGFQ